MKLNINFFKFYKLFFIISIILVTFSLFLMLFGNKFGKGLKFGTDFVGGVEIVVTFQKDITTQQLNEAFKKGNVKVNINEVVSRNNRFFIKRGIPEGMEGMDASKELTAFIDKELGNYEPHFDKSRVVSGIISSENTNSAIKVVILALIGIGLYVAFRFSLHFALGAIIALFHDIIIIIGAVILTGKEMNALIITALLTILGYSVNDTIILFDRVRENIKNKMTLDPIDLFNRSTNQIFSRTLITSATTIAVVIALFFNSSGDLNDFAFALIVGIISGTYSSLYVASGYMLLFKKVKFK